MLLFWSVYFLCQVIYKDGVGPPHEFFNAWIGALLGFALSANTHVRQQELFFFGDKKVQYWMAVRQTTFMAMAMLALLVMVKDVDISRFFIVVYILSAYALNTLCVTLLPKYMGRVIFGGSHGQRILVIGGEIAARRFLAWLKRTEVLGVAVEGVLLTDERPDGRVWHGQDDLLERVRDFLKRRSVSQIIVTGILSPPSEVGRLVTLANSIGIRLLVVNNLSEVFRHSISCFKYLGVDFIGLREEPLQNPFNRMSKRVLDVIISLPVVLFLLPPLMVLVWLIQRFQSPGPVFFRQMRAGVYQNPFSCLKFRTMYVGGDGSRQATMYDQRIYPFGAFLRRTSLDEIPQFWNALIGQMSVVGPRPHLAEHNEQFAAVMDTYQVRSLVKPGITGLAQVRGYRGEVKGPDDVVHRAKSDVEYIENWSMHGDISIIFRTVGEVLRPPVSAL